MSIQVKKSTEYLAIVALHIRIIGRVRRTLTDVSLMPRPCILLWESAGKDAWPFNGRARVEKAINQDPRSLKLYASLIKSKTVKSV